MHLEMCDYLVPSKRHTSQVSWRILNKKDGLWHKPTTVPSDKETRPRFERHPEALVADFTVLCDSIRR